MNCLTSKKVHIHISYEQNKSKNKQPKASFYPESICLVLEKLSLHFVGIQGSGDRLKSLSRGTPK